QDALGIAIGADDRDDAPPKLSIGLDGSVGDTGLREVAIRELKSPDAAEYGTYIYGRIPERGRSVHAERGVIAGLSAGRGIDKQRLRDLRVAAIGAEVAQVVTVQQIDASFFCPRHHQMRERSGLVRQQNDVSCTV